MLGVSCLYVIPIPISNIVVSSYDIFIDLVEAPTDRNSINEVIIWVGYREPNSPLSDRYDSDGKPVPWETNVSLGRRQWDVYLYT
jgi:hypothetical protein